MTSPTTIDYAKLHVPAGHGEVLVAPDPALWGWIAQANAAALRHAPIYLAGVALADCRRSARNALAGTDDKLIVVTGHQPEFMHAGAWAKGIVAGRLAQAVEGIGINVVVDNDTLRQTTISVPAIRNERLTTEQVRFTDLPAGHTFEQVPRAGVEDLNRFEQEVISALGKRYAESAMPDFMSALRGAANVRDWVDQIIAGRKGLDALCGVTLTDRRVSEYWGGPLLVDLLCNAPRFAASYNKALADYRRANRVRGTNRPIPDLKQDGDWWEVPVWAQRASSRRTRLFARTCGGEVQLLANDTRLGALPAMGTAEPAWPPEPFGGWRLRPRALTLTLWARLLVADLFIHGIGGAKYDRITDAIIRDYYGLTPPQVGCVTATLGLDLPTRPATAETLRTTRQALRDLQHNPQRNVGLRPDLLPLIEQRTDAVNRANKLRDNYPRNHRARAAVFQEIRDISAAIVAAHSEAVAQRQAAVDQAVEDIRWNGIARSREFFVALCRKTALKRLADSLPAENVFRT